MGETAITLRAKAKKLMERADKIENAAALKIGRAVLKIHNGEWADFEIEKFKSTVTEIIKGGDGK